MPVDAWHRLKATMGECLQDCCHPPPINYASRHPIPSDRVDCKKRLMEAGYCFIDIGGETLAIRRQRQNAPVSAPILRILDI